MIIIFVDQDNIVFGVRQFPGSPQTPETGTDDDNSFSFVLIHWRILPQTITDMLNLTLRHHRLALTVIPIVVMRSKAMKDPVVILQTRFFATA